MIFDKIDPFYFMASFGIGVFLSYIFTPEPKIVIQYPTPENAGKITYMDDAGVCYRYKALPVGCPEDKTKISNVEIQNHV